MFYFTMKSLKINLQGINVVSLRNYLLPNIIKKFQRIRENEFCVEQTQSLICHDTQWSVQSEAVAALERCVDHHMQRVPCSKPRDV